MKRAIWSTCLSGAVMACAGAGCSGPRAGAESTASPVVAVEKVMRADMEQRLPLAAEFRPFQEVEVHAKVAGYLKSIFVDVGDRVSAGQLLAVLEIPELQDEMRQDEAAVKRADQEIRRAQAERVRAESAHEVAHLAAGRLSSILKTQPNLVAQQDVDEAAGRDRVSEAQVATASAALASAGEQLEFAKASQGKTKTLYAYSQITAPFAGVITHRYADVGAMIQAGTSSQTQAMPIVRLSQNSRLRLVIPVPESAVSRIRPGTPVELTVQSLRQKTVGTVARVAERLDADTRTMRVEVDVPNPTLELVPGMYASASIVLSSVKNALVVPVQAVDRNETASSVLIVNREGRLEAKNVTLGLETSDRVEVSAGLGEGDLVVVGSRSQLRVGAIVTPKVQTPTAGDKGDR
jgi:RND family efflux transporter MFP subunit